MTARKPAPQSVPATRAGDGADGGLVGGASAASLRWVHVDTVRPWHRNPRDHDRDNVEALAADLRAYGWGDTATVRPAPGGRGMFELVSGHGRVEALRSILRSNPAFVLPGSLTPGEFPANVRTDLDDTTATGLALASNNPKLFGKDNDDKLLDLLGDYRQRDANVLASAGYTDGDIDALLKAENDKGTKQPEPEGAGTLMVLVECYDATHQAELVARLETDGLNVKPVTMMTDPHTSTWKLTPWRSPRR